MSKPEADKDKTPSFYQRYRWPLLIGGGLLLGAAIGGGLLALAIFLGPWVLGGALIATLVKFVGIPLAIAIGAAAGAVLGTLVTGAILGVRHIIKSQKKTGCSEEALINAFQRSRGRRGGREAQSDS